MTITVNTMTQAQVRQAMSAAKGPRQAVHIGPFALSFVRAENGTERWSMSRDWRTVASDLNRNAMVNIVVASLREAAAAEIGAEPEALAA